MSKPINSPWGEVQGADQIGTGLFIVHTAGHGGLMIADSAPFRISDLAKSLGGERFGKYWCFEEDCACMLAFFELQKQGVTIERLSVDDMLRSINHWFPAYLKNQE